MNLEQALSVARANQRRAGDYIRSAGRYPEWLLDVEGAKRGAEDNLMEEAIILVDHTDYREFLRQKEQYGSYSGFDPIWMPDFLFGFQRVLVDWALRKGKAAIFADCGLGKTPMQLVWAENVVRKTNKPVLILTPLAVAQQTIKEGQKFGIECERCSAGSPATAKIAVANYEKLHHFNPDDFAGVVCDESSILKSFDGKRRGQITEFMRTLPYRLLCTATAAPNDYTELGTSAEALGEMGHMDMLTRFFRSDNSTVDVKGAAFGGRHAGQRWRFKGHAQRPFWRWVCSWARALRKPSDLGFEDDGFILPPLHEREHVIETRTLAPGALFAMPATNMREEREERRRTIPERCEAVAELVSNTSEPAVIWCHLNDEGRLLSRLIPDAREVAGSTPDEEKEETYEAFGSGQLRVIITKPKIGAWGLNWQHCAHVVTFASHSYEQYYQAVRRCWRFGQTRPVRVDLVVTEGERGAKENLRRKSEAADRMFSALVSHMNEELHIEREQNYNTDVQVPSWL